eukprot:15329720-Ditylum_brightwellii.AAC.1
MEVSRGVAQLLIGQIKAASTMNAFLLSLKASGLVFPAEGTPSGCAAAPVEESSCREWARGKNQPDTDAKKASNPASC